MKEQRSYFKKALVLLMAVLMVFTYMPSMAFAGSGPDASNSTPASTSTYQVYTGSVIAAPIEDKSSENPIAQADLATYYGVSYKTTTATETAPATATATVAALDLKSFKLTSDGNSGKWVGLAIEVPAETTYANIQIGTDPDALISAGKTKADYTANEKSYVTYYWDMDTPISNLYFSFDGGTTKYAISVQTATDCNIYVGTGSDAYTGNEKFVLGKTYQMTAYVCQGWGSYYPCKWNTAYLSGLGIDDTADDATWGYGASVEFTPTKAGKYYLSLTDTAGKTIKTLTLEVVANNLRGLASGSLDFYYDDTYGEQSMLGNSWCTGKELAATKGQSNESLRTDYKYLSAFVKDTSVKSYEKMSVDWYYSDTYSPTGKGYTKVSTGGRANGTAGHITYYNGDGTYYPNSFFFNIYPDVTTAGTYYYYVVISDGTNTITSISNQAVVTVGLPKGTLSEISDGVDSSFQFKDFSMLGNNWYAGNELKANVNATSDEMRKDYLYLSACTTVPNEKSYTDMTVKWYYGKTYSATGEGYTEVSTGGAASGTAGTAEQITYYNGKNNYNGDYFFFNIYPDVRTAGTYYYYAEISYTDTNEKVHKISSVGCQAMVIISEKSYTESLKGNITVSFTLNGYGSFPGISTQSVTVKNGSSVGDVFKKVLDGAQYTYEGLEKGYISSITSKSGVSLAHFGDGKNSGWMYLIDSGSGNFAPNVGLNSYILSNGDKITWYFTPDYTKDSYAKASMTTQTEEQKKAEEEAKAAEEEAKIAAENAEKAVAGAADTSSMDRSVKTKKGNVKVTFKPSTKTQSYIDEMTALGYTVKYRFYRSTKKSSDYKAMLTKTTKTYINTAGKAGTRYYYKTQIRVYDKDGKLIAKTALKDCKYATRIFG